MDKTLISVGLDVGTTTTQLVVSELTVANQASAFAVPRMEITNRQIRYRSPVHFTPMQDAHHVDGDAIRQLVEKEYVAAGLHRQGVDTGAVIITGETSRKENARRVLHSLSDFAGDFVVATAGPHLESMLAAKGSGAVALSEQTGKTVLHMDIGGGTTNLALIRDGQIQRTGCLNVGGRLAKLDPAGKLLYRSPVLETLWPWNVGQIPDAAALEQLTGLLVRALETAAGLRTTAIPEPLYTGEAGVPWVPPEPGVIYSFSGGVADCIAENFPDNAFGDIGPLLGKAIRNSGLCQEEYRLGKETIRATVIGAGCHSAQLSGSTVYYQNTSLPMKNIPVALFSEQMQQSPDFWKEIARSISLLDADSVALALPGANTLSYAKIITLATQIAKGTAGKPVCVALETDAAKALGHALQLRLPAGTPCLCIDRVQLAAESYLDVGMPIGPCLPVVVKTLVLSKKEQL